MLFVFPKTKHYRSWMQGMRFSIDIIWLDKKGVVGLTENIQPPSEKSPLRFYKSPQPAKYMLEVNAGFAKKNNIRVGDPVQLQNVNRKFTIALADKAGFDKAAWNAFVERNYPPAGAFLETWEWGEFQKALGHKTDRYVVTEHVGSELSRAIPVAVFTLTRYWSSLGLQYGYLPRGPVIAKELVDEESRHFPILRAVKCWARKQLPTLAFLRIEPPFSYISPDNAWHGFRTPSYYIQPPHNTLVSLKETEEEILARFHSSTRSNIRRAERRGVSCQAKTILSEKDVNDFFAMIKSTVDRNHGKNAYPDERYLRTFLSLVSSTRTGSLATSGQNLSTTGSPALKLVAFCGYQNGQPAATHIAVFFGSTATYLFGASYADRLNSKVETYLHWSAMREAKRRGMTYYDLGGIDEKIWPSLTVFKRQFGGQELHYIGNLDIPLHPIAYHLYNFFKKTAKKIRGQG
jgi:lipid II:glycine glycyltransferase (peptidoglycan interpeptide bridge formation enzyme)